MLNNNLKILHAGALRKPMKEIAHILMDTVPGLNIEMDYAGSRACAYAVLDGKDVDIIALADPHVFEDLLVPDYVEIFFVFATDQIVLAYDEFSKQSSFINKENWAEILAVKDVVFGRSDENLDPCGYRTLMVWQLAEKFYNIPGLYKSLYNKCTQDRIYPKSIDLAAALMEGRVDYAFKYLSVVKQFAFKYIELPSKINLSNPIYWDEYQNAVVEVRKKQGMISQIKGAPIEFAVAIPKKSKNMELAKQFIDILTGNQGEIILEECGLIPC
ncbi:extracellular solute-binding protein [Desulfolucanica intricata]|uniref:extracellular solute-binding protein n=1 Tax=Desulfolucanica intricata TaxID=1285191 RepID=UPI0009EEF082|nr:extracellular solute-binding protein [Desulfolucanica intricata]